MGKSSLLTRFAHQKFSEVYLTTIGVDFKYSSSYPGLGLSSMRRNASNFIYGTQQGKNASARSPRLTIEVPTVSSWCMI